LSQEQAPGLAAGGISDARGVRAAMAFGADGVVAGSAFLVMRKEGDVIPYPIYSHLTKGIREDGARRGEKKSIALWAGSSASLCRGGSAAEVFERLTKGLDRE
jgi:NAD(P)H-dependent flavin oxidoreductase YrpB (nitropropane dioxygenase family)